MNLNELIQKEGFEVPSIIIEGTSDFEYYKHVPGAYEGRLGKLTIKYVDLDGKKCDANAPGAKPKHGTLDIFITASPDGHKFSEDLTGKRYGEIIYKQYIPLEPERQWQNKNLFNLFRIDNVQVVENPDDKNFKVNLGNLIYFIGRTVAFELAVSDKGNTFLKSLFLTDKSPLTEEKLKKDFELIKKWYELADSLLEAEKTANGKKDNDDKILQSSAPQVKTEVNILSQAGLNPSDYE